MQDFRNKLFTYNRYNDVVFDEPLNISIKWYVPIPPGYSVDNLVERRIFRVDENIKGVVTRSVQNDTVLIRVEISSNKIYFPFNKYPEIIRFFDNLINEVEVDITFRHI